jgi:hypothetical protein
MSALTWTRLLEECRGMHNDVCILYDSQIVRLVGCHDGEEDYYYIVRGFASGSKEWKASCVGHIYSLRGLIPPERYKQTEEILSLNGCGPSEKLIATKDVNQ